MSEPTYQEVGEEVLGLLKVPQAAEYLAVSTRTVRRLISSGRLKSVRIGTAVRIVPEDLTAYVESLRQAAGNPRRKSSRR